MPLVGREWLRPIVSIVWDSTRLLFGVVVIAVAAVIGFIHFHDVRYLVPLLGFIFSLLFALSAKKPLRLSSVLMLIVLLVLLDMPFQSHLPVGVVLVLSAPLLPLAAVMRALSASVATRWEILSVGWIAFLFGMAIPFAYWFAYPPAGIDVAVFFVPLLLGFVTCVLALYGYAAVRPSIVRRRQRPHGGDQQTHKS